MTIATRAAPGTRGILAPALARVGLIIPSSNRMTEPQLRYFAPPTLGIHVTRLQMTGKWNRKLSQLGDDLLRAASSLADAQADLIVFHCTGTSMEEGPEVDARAMADIQRETGIPALSTAGAVVEALRTLSLRTLVLASPYVQATNDHEKDYLAALGFSVLADVALGLKGGDAYITVPPERWIEITREIWRKDADGLFLSCTNTTQIETIERLERELGVPVVNSNQAVLWATLRRLRTKLGAAKPAANLGRLFGF